jgi:hypothetical protein
VGSIPAVATKFKIGLNMDKEVIVIENQEQSIKILGKPDGDKEVIFIENQEQLIKIFGKPDGDNELKKDGRAINKLFRYYK